MTNGDMLASTIQCLSTLIDAPLPKHDKLPTLESVGYHENGGCTAYSAYIIGLEQRQALETNNTDRDAATVPPRS